MCSSLLLSWYQQDGKETVSWKCWKEESTVYVKRCTCTENKIPCCNGCGKKWHVDKGCVYIRWKTFSFDERLVYFAFSALTLLVGQQEGHLACKKWDGGGGHWLVQMEWHPAGWSVYLPVNLPLHHKVEKFSSGTSSPGWSQKKGRKTVFVCVWFILQWQSYLLRLVSFVVFLHTNSV